MTREEIEQEIENVLIEKTDNLKSITGIKDQVSQAKAMVITRNQYSDAGWFASANTALRISGRRDQEYATKLSSLRKMLRDTSGASYKDNTVSFERAFMKAAKLKLTGEVYKSICDDANNLENYIVKQPPCTNEFVADGCEKFAEQS